MTDWITKLGSAFADAFERTMALDKKYIEPYIGEEAEKKYFGDTLENIIENKAKQVAKDFNDGRNQKKEEIRNENAKSSPRDSSERCERETECPSGGSDEGWVEIL